MTQDLERLRRRIDRVDRLLFKLLAERMRISRTIGKLKLKLGLPVFQRARLLALLENRERAARKIGLSPNIGRKLFKLIHDESVRAQRELAQKRKN